MTTKEPFVERFLRTTDHLARVFVQAARSDADAPVIHRHDEFEAASEEELADFVVETDSEGHHYAVRKSDPVPEESE
ncbi:hypothetical protein [Specibacter cremeus]|uniref:hypothetical protein n=1 Tax=Specibacter cremeus TaxID=1629051 RepID=UPI000F77196A|nr:hypothetical protein [Specibacter cremeus]